MEQPTKIEREKRGVDSVKRMVLRVCKICGDEHHEPDYLEIPLGCVCDWKTWDYDGMTSLPPACDRYEGDGKQNCSKCEHDKACHAPS